MSSQPTCPYSQIPTNETCSQTSPYEPVWPSNSSNVYFGYPISLEILCQDSRFFLFCPTTLVIHIYAAYFGVQAQTSTDSCVYNTNSSAELNEKCYVVEAFDVIKSSCEGKSTCKLRANIATLGGADICPNNRKQLFVQYQCVDQEVRYINQEFKSIIY